MSSGPVAAREREAAGRGLLVGHANRALEDRPRLAVSGIEGVVDLADEIGPAALVEALAVGAPEEIERRDLALGDVGVQRVGRRSEVIGVLAALLVQVHVDVRPVVARDLDAAAGLGLGLGEPVAIHVEQVVVRAPARPRLVVLRVVGGGIGHRRAALQVLEHEPGPAVGVLHRIDEHEGLAEHGLHVGVALGGQQVIRLHQGRVRRGDLVAVDAVSQPDDDRGGLDQAGLVGRRHTARIGQLLQVRLHLLEAGDALRTADDHQPQGPAFPGAGVFEQARPGGRGLLEGLEVWPDLLGRGDLRTGVVAKHLADGGDSRVVLRAWPERLLLGLGGGRGGQAQGDGDTEGQQDGTHER